MEPKKRAEKEEEGRYTMLLGGATFIFIIKLNTGAKLAAFCSYKGDTLLS